MPEDGHEILEPPGGAVRHGEAIKHAPVRETEEETGWLVASRGNPIKVHREATWAGQHFSGDEWFCLAEPLKSGDGRLESYEKPWFVGITWIPIGRLRAPQSDLRIEPHNLSEIVTRLQAELLQGDVEPLSPSWEQ